MNGKRLYWIDLIRSFACICVVITHAPISIQQIKNGLPAISIYNLFAVGGGSILFFMITGALIFTSSSTQDFSTFIKKRLTRVVVPMFFWSIIALLVDWLYNEKISAGEFFESVMQMPFEPQVGIFWFIYAVMGIYLLAPILSYWLKTAQRRTVEIYLCIFLFTLVIPYIGYYFPIFKEPLNSPGYLQYFTGFICYALLGFYLRKWPLKINSPIFITIVCIGIIFPICCYVFSWFTHDLVQNRQTINAICLAITYFTILQHIKIADRVAPYIQKFAQFTFGIYLIHFILLRNLVWPILAPLNMNYIYGVPATALVTVASSIIIVYIFSKLPFHKYTVSI